MHTTIVPPYAPKSPAGPYGHVSQIMAWPPISSGITGRA